MDVLYLMEREMMSRGYSNKSIHSYINCVKKFLSRCHIEPRKIKKNDIKGYIHSMIDKKLCGSTINVHLNALKFLMVEILNKKVFFSIRYSKIPRRLPTVLTKEEVLRLINAIENPKHSLIIKLLYSAGLRVSELVNLKVGDIEFEKNYGWVRSGKGKKDRLFILSKKIKEDLKNYIDRENLDYDSWVFKGRNGQISQRTIHVIVKKATKKAKINKNVHCHTLRHSFATHLIENGYDIASVQSLLGHNSAQTTMIYIHMASPKLISVESPYDKLYENNS